MPNQNNSLHKSLKQWANGEIRGHGHQLGNWTPLSYSEQWEREVSTCYCLKCQRYFVVIPARDDADESDYLHCSENDIDWVEEKCPGKI